MEKNHHKNLLASLAIVSLTVPLSHVVDKPETVVVTPAHIVVEVPVVLAEIDHLQKKVCLYAPLSTACTDPSVLAIFRREASRVWVPTEILLGIGHAESRLGVDFNTQNRVGCRSESHNWFWLKARHNGIKAIKDQNIGRGCWLYRFESLEDAIISIANVVGVGYRGCFTKRDPIHCMSYRYVWDANVPETSWIQRVKIFY